MEDYLEGVPCQIIKLEATHFILNEGRLMRKDSEGVLTLYIELEFRGDLIQRMHNEYGYLSSHEMKDLVVRRGWWLKMDQDIQEFVESCSNFHIAQKATINTGT